VNLTLNLSLQYLCTIHGYRKIPAKQLHITRWLWTYFSISLYNTYVRYMDIEKYLPNNYISLRFPPPHNHNDQQQWKWSGNSQSQKYGEITEATILGPVGACSIICASMSASRSHSCGLTLSGSSLQYYDGILHVMEHYEYLGKMGEDWWGWWSRREDVLRKINFKSQEEKVFSTAWNQM
jgi:hypothetical protein